MTPVTGKQSFMFNKLILRLSVLVLYPLTILRAIGKCINTCASVEAPGRSYMTLS